jgi:hypothetical protein
MTPWYPVLGNHDYHRKGRVEAQLQYRSENNDRWKLRERYYRLSDGFGVDLFFIDTTPFIPLSDDPAVNKDGQGISYTASQMDWLEKELSASTAAWKIAVGHHNIYSAGGAHPDFREMQEYFPNLFKKYKVAAYLNGHQHNFAHVVKAGVHYITCGAGSETVGRSYFYPAEFASALAPDSLKPFTDDDKAKLPANCKLEGDDLLVDTSRLNSEELGGFMVIKLRSETLSFTFINEEGSELYGSTIDRIK